MARIPLTALKAAASLLTLTSAAIAPAVMASDTTILYLGGKAELAEVNRADDELWIPASQLPAVNGFELKPEGACIDDLCVPVAREGADAIVRENEGKEWFSLTRFADKLQQSYVGSETGDVWSFAPIPVTRSAFLQSAVAPDFELPDRHGKSVRLSELRGKKVLLITWASW